MSNITCGLGKNGTIIGCGTTAISGEDIDGYAIPVTGLSNGTFLQYPRSSTDLHLSKFYLRSAGYFIFFLQSEIFNIFQLDEK